MGAPLVAAGFQPVHVTAGGVGVLASQPKLDQVVPLRVLAGRRRCPAVACGGSGAAVVAAAAIAAAAIAAAAIAAAAIAVAAIAAAAIVGSVAAASGVAAAETQILARIVFPCTTSRIHRCLDLCYAYCTLPTNATIVVAILEACGVFVVECYGGVGHHHTL